MTFFGRDVVEGHRRILNDFLGALKDKCIAGILDAGSGRTSLSAITELFPDTPVDAVIYPGDTRKLNSVSEIRALHPEINVIEKDICSDAVCNEYDLIVAHLLLGEAAKFGSRFDDMLEKIITMKYRYLIIIDYLEDPSVNENAILKMCDGKDLTVVYRSYFTNEQPQTWEDFTGTHNFGYLIKNLSQTEALHTSPEK